MLAYGRRLCSDIEMNASPLGKGDSLTERIWDRFLTEQDHTHLATRGPKPVGFGSKPALLLIDLYRWVFGDRPEPLMEAVKTWPSSCGLAAWNAVPHIQALLKKAREVTIPIVHVTGLEDEAGVKRDGFRETGERSSMSAEARERHRNRYDIIDEVRPLSGEAVIRKSSPSAFWGTPLIGHLNFLDVDTLITCGESTSGCVRASVVDGFTYRFRMIVVEECVFDRTEASHAINLFDMNQKYADVLSLATAIQFLDSWRAQTSRLANQRR